MSYVSSYTKTFALPNDPDPMNPFVVFDTGNGQNMWGPNATASVLLILDKPVSEKFSQIKLAVDAVIRTTRKTRTCWTA